MKAIVIGLGSMGRRRARLLKEIDASVMIIGIDTQKERREQAKKEIGIETAESIDVACSGNDIDVAFVATSPLAHASVITECLRRNLHVFTELNLTDNGYEENITLARQKGKILFLSSTFLYRKEIFTIEDEVKRCECPLTYMYHAGQYLSDWHPWESYKNFFVGDKATNGCREFMAIEFPWIIDTFGKIKSVHSTKYKNSTLEVDFADSYQIMFEHETGHRGLLTIDVVSRKPVRNLEVFGERLYLTWDGTPNGLFKYDYNTKENVKLVSYEKAEHQLGYSPFIIENAYRSEIENFFDVIKGEDIARYSFENDREVLSLINKIEGIRC